MQLEVTEHYTILMSFSTPLLTVYGAIKECLYSNRFRLHNKSCIYYIPRLFVPDLRNRSLMWTQRILGREGSGEEQKSSLPAYDIYLS